VELLKYISCRCSGITRGFSVFWETLILEHISCLIGSCSHRDSHVWVNCHILVPTVKQIIFFSRAWVSIIPGVRLISFSKSTTYIGFTDLVQHTINTGTALPIRQPIRRLPYISCLIGSCSHRDSHVWVNCHISVPTVKHIIFFF
jgi:hypothetical protein